MTDELLQKLQRLLDSKFTNEMKVVYLLVELRKLMERGKYEHAVLSTFCNWVVHASLDRNVEGNRLILKEFDDFFDELHTSKTVSKQRQHVSLATFRLALIDCFGHFGLSATFVHELPKWKQFCKLYCLIVSECPIVVKASNADLKHIKKIELVKVERGHVVKEWPAIQWKLSFKDGSTRYWSFQML